MKKLFFLSFLLTSLSIAAQGVEWQAQNENLVQGDTVRVAWRVFGFDSIAAFQYAVHFDVEALEFAGIETTGALPGYGVECCFGFWTLSDGVIKSVWVDPYSRTVADGSEVFSFVFVAKETGPALHEVFALYPEGLAPHAWDYHQAYLPFTFSFVDNASGTASPSAGGWMVCPNPCNRVFSIRGDVGRVEVYDMAGSRVHCCTSGAQVVLPAPGAYWVKSDGVVKFVVSN